MTKPTLCLDFDGVLHSYSSGWKGATVIPDPPVIGALQFIIDAMEHFKIAIYSSRSGQEGGISAMIQWLGYWSVDKVHGMAPDFDHGAWGSIEWPTSKPAAFLTIDDRALTFDGTWPNIAELLDFKPWNKREFGATASFPQGKLSDDDQGGLRIGVGYDKLDGLVRIELGKPVSWLAFPPDHAVELAKIILKNAGAKTVEISF